MSNIIQCLFFEDCDLDLEANDLTLCMAHCPFMIHKHSKFQRSRWNSSADICETQR